MSNRMLDKILNKKNVAFTYLVCFVVFLVSLIGASSLRLFEPYYEQFFVYSFLFLGAGSVISLIFHLSNKGEAAEITANNTAKNEAVQQKKIKTELDFAEKAQPKYNFELMDYIVAKLNEGHDINNIVSALKKINFSDVEINIALNYLVENGLIKPAEPAQEDEDKPPEPPSGIAKKAESAQKKEVLDVEALDEHTGRKCPFCEKSFDDQWKLQRHIFRVHKTIHR